MATRGRRGPARGGPPVHASEVRPNGSSLPLQPMTTQAGQPLAQEPLGLGATEAGEALRSELRGRPPAVSYERRAVLRPGERRKQRDETDERAPHLGTPARNSLATSMAGRCATSTWWF